MKTILLIEDNLEILENLKEFLELEGFKTLATTNGKKGISLAMEFIPDLIICDVLMPEMNGLDAIEKILAIHPNTSIVINSIKDDTDTIFKAIQSGAVGYIDKQSFVMNFHEVFSSIDNQGAYMTPKIARKVFSFFQKSSNVYEALSARESEIVQGILDGLSYKMIADRYDISIDTVRFHIKAIYRKLKINSKSQLFNIFKFKP